MAERRTFAGDDFESCLVEDLGNQLLYEPCPPTVNTAGVLSLGTVAVLALAWVVWLAPGIQYRRSQLDKIATAAKRSLG